MISESAKKSAAAVLSFVVFISLFFIAYGIATSGLIELPEKDFAFIIISILVILTILSWAFSGVVLWFLNLSPPIPVSWLYAATLGALLESVAFGLTPLNSIHFWFLLPWVMTLASPFIIYPMKLRELREMHSFKGGLMDKDVLDVARKYGGIITLGVVVWKLNVPLETAQKCLERFVKHGEAIKRKVGALIIYDFPGARIYLSRIDNQIIEVMINNPHGTTRTSLLQATGLTLETIDESLRRLESMGIIYYDAENDFYKLRGIMPYKKPPTA